MGNYLLDQVQLHLGSIPHVGNIRGRGLFVGIEFVKDEETKLPFEPSAGVTGKVHSLALEYGVATYPGTGTADGALGNHIVLAPPFTITSGEIDVIVEVLGRVLREVFVQ